MLPNDAKLVKIASTTLGTERLFERNDHALDRVTIPDALEDLIGETQHDQILDHLFAKIVIDAVDLLFDKQLGQMQAQLVRCLQVATEWFLHDYARKERP